MQHKGRCLNQTDYLCVKEMLACKKIFLSISLNNVSTEYRDIEKPIGTLDGASLENDSTDLTDSLFCREMFL